MTWGLSEIRKGCIINVWQPQYIASFASCATGRCDAFSNQKCKASGSTPRTYKVLTPYCSIKWSTQFLIVYEYTRINKSARDKYKCTVFDKTHTHANRKVMRTGGKDAWPISVVLWASQVMRQNLWFPYFTSFTVDRSRKEIRSYNCTCSLFSHKTPFFTLGFACKNWNKT